ncbi:MAG: hypothetical protein R3C45_18890 [Phycisphaerales bacterium]
MIATLTAVCAFVAATLITGPAPEPISLNIGSAVSDGGAVTQVLNIKTTSDWTAAAIVIELDAGAIVQDRYFAADDAQDAQALTLPVSASATGPEGFGKVVKLAGACDDSLGGEKPWMDSRRLDVCWYNTIPGDVGVGRVGKVTLSADAVGRWTLAVMQADDNARYCFAGPIIQGRMLLDEWP